MTDNITTLRARAVDLRRQGKSRTEIKKLLGITSNWTLNEVLRGEPPIHANLRANAKDDLRERAKELHAQGKPYREIAEILGVSKSSCSLWLRDEPKPQRLGYEESRRRAAEGVRQYWEQERPLREAERQKVRDEAAEQVGMLSTHDVLIAGALIYWCEGSKAKPWNNAERVVFVNSDPGLIQFFLRFLEVAGVEQDRIGFRIQIHESADVPAAEAFWAEVTRLPTSRFHRTTLKTHNPKTVRKNVNDDYHGCLTIRVTKSADLYRRIEGWARAAMHSAVVE